MVLILATFLVVLYISHSAKNIDLKDLEKNLISKTDISEMNKCGDKDLKKFIGINSSDIDSFIYYKSKEALGVDEILIIKLKNKNNATEYIDTIDKRVSSQIKVFQSYGPKQVKLLKNSLIKEKGNYIFYATCKDISKYEEVFIDAVQ